MSIKKTLLFDNSRLKYVDSCENFSLNIIVIFKFANILMQGEMLSLGKATLNLKTIPILLLAEFALIAILYHRL